MPTRDPRVDAYIARAAPFARPVLTHLRAVVHAAVPGVEETIKWGMPHFMHGGILCGLAAFKAHCAFHVRGAEDLLGGDARGDAMGQFGRITALSDLPPKARLARILKAAAARNEARAKAPRAPRKRAPKPEAKVPPDLAAALKGNARAGTTFQASRPRRGAASTWSGLSRRRGRTPARGGSPRPSRGWPRARAATGSTSAAEPAGRRPAPYFIPFLRANSSPAFCISSWLMSFTWVAKVQA